MAARAVLIYWVALAVVRLGKKRLFGKSSAMDVVLSVMVGSVISRAINGSATLPETAVASFVLVMLHALAAKLAFHSDAFGIVIKGKPHTLIHGGELQRDAMRKSDVSEHDLEEAARSEGRLTGIKQIEEARMERNGKISVIPKKSPPKIVEVRVEDGVQTVRLEIA